MIYIHRARKIPIIKGIMGEFWLYPTKVAINIKIDFSRFLNMKLRRSALSSMDAPVIACGFDD